MFLFFFKIYIGPGSVFIPTKIYGKTVVVSFYSIININFALYQNRVISASISLKQKMCQIIFGFEVKSFHLYFAVEGRHRGVPYNICQWVNKSSSNFVGPINRISKLLFISVLSTELTVGILTCYNIILYVPVYIYYF